MVNILFISREPHPSFRPDIRVLFGKALPNLGIFSDLVAESESILREVAQESWGGGTAYISRAHSGQIFRQFGKFLHAIKVLVKSDHEKYRVIQVRDSPLTAVFALVLARVRKQKFVFWLSFPQPLAQIERAKSLGAGAGKKYWFPLIQGVLGQSALYKIVLPYSDHVFVQSEFMKSEIAATGARDIHKMTAVPMGVDLDEMRTPNVENARNLFPSLAGRRIVAYLGILDPIRNSEMLIDLGEILREKSPNVTLVLIGSASDSAYESRLRAMIAKKRLQDAILITGWLPPSQALDLLALAEIGLSPFPRGKLLDSASPTKLIEYMAIGLPVVVNDQPDQKRVVEESGCGLCVACDALSFHQAIVQLLENRVQSREMGLKGKKYVEERRSYAIIAKCISSVYLNLASA